MNNLTTFFVVWLFCIVLIIKRRKSDRWLRRRWMRHPINWNRDYYGQYNTLFQEYKHFPEKFYNYLRMDYSTFKILLSLLKIRLSKQHPSALRTEFRLVVALRYLISGDQLKSIADNFYIGHSTAILVIIEVCKELVNVLQPTYLRVPVEQEWRYIAADFLKKWNLPNCVGAIDGKHVNIIAPANSGSLFFNYKKNFSLVLFAACDANYLFTAVHVGEMGSNSDAAIFADSEFGNKLKENQLNLPKGTATLPGSTIRTPCFFVGDDAFPLRNNLLKPYAGVNLTHSQKIFNYRISRARRVIENAFGILRSRFRILSKSIPIEPEHATTIVAACTCLHNFIHINLQKEEQNEMVYLSKFSDDNGCELRGALHMRDTMAGYFLTEEGKIPWQEDHIGLCEDLMDVDVDV